VSLRIASSLTQFRPPKNRELDLTTKFNGSVQLGMGTDVARFDTFHPEDKGHVSQPSLAVLTMTKEHGFGEKKYPPTMERLPRT
jgi:hypothetical protein